MKQRATMTQLIGNTPLIYLREASEQTGCDIYGKAEFLNPGGSIKDRTALGIIQAAEKSGELTPGGVIVEGTAGNTGIGLTILANAMGYQSVVVMPESQSAEKIERLDILGAELILTADYDYSSPNHYIHQAEQIANSRKKTETHGAIWARQFDNPANREIHASTTGPEIWDQTEGTVDAFICAVGTGGTLAGVAEALRERNPAVKIGIADPAGSALYNYFSNGELTRSSGRSITEGIGVSFLPGNLAGTKLDFSYRIEDEDALPLLFALLLNEGLLLGGSAAINVAGAVEMAKEMGPGHTIVTVLCDGGDRYRSKLFNPNFLYKNKLPVPDSTIGRLVS
ncbi:MAG: cysteine synthase A [Pseudomonadales bacterium]